MMTTAEAEDQRHALFLASQNGRAQRQMMGPDAIGGNQYGQPQPMTPEMRRQQIAQQFQQKIMGQTPTTAMGGMGQLAAGIVGAVNDYRKEGQQFPTAPGGASPSFGTTLGNFFTGRNNGGLY